jgi:hypothetical protein
MTDMMLTGRVYNAVDGERAGCAVPGRYGQALAKTIFGRKSPERPGRNFADACVAPHCRPSADHGA